MSRFQRILGFSLLCAPIAAWSPVISGADTPGWIQALRRQERARISVEDAGAKQVYSAAVASSPEAQTRGLSGRHEPLAPDEAMAFVYEVPHRMMFWMKETHLPLSIAFFDSNGLLVDRFEMPVETDPSNPIGRYLPSRDSIVVLEAASGAFAGLRPGHARLSVLPEASGA